MQKLHNPTMYPQALRHQIEAMPPLATEIANRWVLGWPRTVSALLKTNQYLPALVAQEEKERRVYSDPGNTHLARHEIAELYDVAAGPPAA